MIVRTLSTELGGVVRRGATALRIYADANVPAGLVAFMREQLGWDVFFVMEDAGLRRASDLEHFRLARQLHRTLVTLDRDYFDDRRFPSSKTCGVIVVSAPDEVLLARVLRRVDRHLLRPGARPEAPEPQPPGPRPQAPGPASAPVGAAPPRPVVHPGPAPDALPLFGRKVHATLDWPDAPTGEGRSCRARRRRRRRQSARP